MPSHLVCRQGIALVPEGRRLFARMTVEENLEMGGYRAEARRARAATLERVYRLFPILSERRLVPGQRAAVDGQGGPIEFMTVLQEHGDIPSLGFRFGNVAYSADIKGLPADSLAAMAGLDVWIVDALRRPPHPSHFNLDEALAWIARVKPKRAILTNLHSDMDYAELRASLPANVEPAYDGMTFAA